MSSRAVSRVGRMAPSLSAILIYVQTILLLAVTLFPVLWLIQLSLKVESEAFRMPPKFVPPFAWGDAPPFGEFAEEKFLDVAELVMRRRDVTLSAAARRTLRAAWERRDLFVP